MRSIDKYKSYKEKYKDSIVIVKEGIFYKSFFDDGKILWYLFDYKYVNDCLSFGNFPYDKVILKLNKLDISYVVIDLDKVALSYKSNSRAYNSYLDLAKEAYDKSTKLDLLLEKVKTVIGNNPSSYEKISSFIDSLLI